MSTGSPRVENTFKNQAAVVPIARGQYDVTGVLIEGFDSATRSVEYSSVDVDLTEEVSPSQAINSYIEGDAGDGWMRGSGWS